MISYQSSQDCLGINKILSPPKNTLQITFNTLEIEVHDFLPIVICENWNFLQISASEPWASPKLQPGLNPKILLLSQRRWGLRFPKTQMTSGPRPIQILPSTQWPFLAQRPGASDLVRQSSHPAPISVRLRDSGRIPLPLWSSGSIPVKWWHYHLPCRCTAGLTPSFSKENG